jgi:hypothetical protein
MKPQSDHVLLDKLKTTLIVKHVDAYAFDYFSFN